MILDQLDCQMNIRPENMDLSTPWGMGEGTLAMLEASRAIPDSTQGPPGLHSRMRGDMCGVRS